MPILEPQSAEEVINIITNNLVDQNKITLEEAANKAAELLKSVENRKRQSGTAFTVADYSNGGRRVEPLPGAE